MVKTKIALTASQHFDRVYPHVKDIVGAIDMRSLDKVPHAENVEKTFHANGFIDEGFDRLVDPVFLRRLQTCGIGSFSFDLGPSCEKVLMDDFYIPASTALSPDQIIEIGARHVERIRSVYKGSISAENLDYHAGGAYEHVCEPSFISRALEMLNIGLTLDIGHAAVTAFTKKMDVKDYISMLPLERVSEVHLSHSVKDDDSHDAPTRGDYDILDFVLSRSSPKYVVIEYFRDPDTIIEQLRALHELLAVARQG